MIGRFALPTTGLMLLTFILFLLVSLGVPTIKSIWFMAFNNGSGTSVTLGTFGACYRTTVTDARELGIAASGCLKAHNGYEYAYQSTRPVLLAEKGLTSALALNPVATAFAGLSTIAGFAAWMSIKRVHAITAFALSVLTTIFAWVAFALDYVFAARARSRLAGAALVSGGGAGPAVWLALGGSIAATIAVILAGIGAFGHFARREQTVATRHTEKVTSRDSA